MRTDRDQGDAFRVHLRERTNPRPRARRAALEEMNRLAALPENKRLLSENEEMLFDRARCWDSVCEVVEEGLGAAEREA